MKKTTTVVDSFGKRTMKLKRILVFVLLLLKILLLVLQLVSYWRA